jgi:hypothetical protein
VPLSRPAAGTGSGVPIAGSSALSFGAILSRFALAGLAAGAVSAVWSLLVTERALEPALAVEEARGGAHHEGPVSRPVQVLGGALGTLVAAVVLALVAAVVFALVRHRLPARTDFGRALVVGGIGFGVLALLPAVAVPANPPAVGDPATIGARTAVYFGVLAGGAVIALLVAAVVSLLRSRGAGAVGATIGGVVVGSLLVAALLLLRPAPDPVPADMPADVVWNFRLASLGQLAVLWTALALTAGALLDRRTRTRA